MLQRCQLILEMHYLKAEIVSKELDLIRGANCFKVHDVINQ
jgi:hypothetical protein